MNYSIIFCLVFALINSKLEINHFKSFVQKAKNILNEESDSEICRAQETQKKCTAKSLDNSEMQCCYISAEVEYNETKGNENFCEAVPKQIGELKEIIELKQTKELLKEVYGFILMNKEEESAEMAEEFSAKGNIKCSNTEINADISFSLTEDEKEMLKSEDHCFYLLANSLDSDEPPVIDSSVKCENFRLREASKKAGIECGYIKAEGKVEGESVTLKTCFPFNYDLLNKITKLKMLKEEFKEMGLEDNVHIEFYNSKGKKVTFDTNNSMFLKINLLLLFIILFIF